MSFARPPRAKLIDQAAADLASRLQGVDPFLRRSLVSALAIVLGGGFDGLYGYVGWASRQAFADQMDGEFVARRASLWGMTQEQATAAEPQVTITGANGVDIPAGTSLQRSDGALYTTLADVVIAAGTAIATVEAAVAGAAGDLAIGQTLQFVAPIAGASNIATCSSVGLEGNDLETIAALRTRVDQRQAEPPQGGNSNDYVAWAKEVAGVTRAWTLPRWLGPGTVGLAFVMDGRPNIIPLAADVAAVQAHVNPLRPVRATLTVIAPATDVVAITAHIVPSTAATKAAALAALADLFTRQQTAAGGTIFHSDLENAIKNATGIVDCNVSVPAGDVATAAGTLAMLGIVTWI